MLALKPLSQEVLRELLVRVVLKGIAYLALARPTPRSNPRHARETFYLAHC